MSCLARAYHRSTAGLSIEATFEAEPLAVVQGEAVLTDLDDVLHSSSVASSKRSTDHSTLNHRRQVGRNTPRRPTETAGDPDFGVGES